MVRDILPLIGRNKDLLKNDIESHSLLLASMISGSRFLVLGGSGTIGQAVTRELYKRNPKKLHVVDISHPSFEEHVASVNLIFVTSSELC